jgi:hypothetical protein
MWAVEPDEAPGGNVQVSQILMEIDNEIARLQQARNLLAGGSDRLPGRAGSQISTPAGKKRRRLSPEGRRKIAEAMKRRWSERRKLAAKSEKAAAPKVK